jgi:hypothetical protein
MFKVKTRHPKYADARVYTIEEYRGQFPYPGKSVTEGTLVYTRYENQPAEDTDLIMTRSGHALFEAVTPEEAELFTGLIYPAAMDRLRELVHESGGQA